MSSKEQQGQTDPSPPVTMTSAGRILAVPTRPAERDKFLEDEGKEIMKSFAMRCSVDKNGLPLKSNKPLNGEEEEELLMILLALSDIEGLTKATAQQIKLKRTLEVVLNKVQVGPRRFAFPTKAIEIAQQAFDRYESEGWGADPENDLLDPEHGSEGSPSPPPAKRRRITSINDNSPRKKQQVALAPPNHAIYGRNGIMRGISVQYGKTTSYKFDPNFNRSNFKVWGHNGCTVGDWWPMQKAVHRDGAHGSSMAGISGTVNEGVTSIVISGGYKGMDHDNGDTILYSGSGSKDNNDPVLPDITKDTAAMQTAHRLQKPIRVIRSSRSDWKYAPTIGCRYDGLYKIVKQTTPKNENGGAYVRFELKREENQPDYDLSRPTADEKRAFDRIQDYY